jgi:hypothetical protein
VIGSMEDLSAASLDDVRELLPHLLRAQQRGAGGRGRLRDQAKALVRKHFAAIPRQAAAPAAGAT